VNKQVSHGDYFDLSANLRVTALHTPYHTRGHICYAVTSVDAAGTSDAEPALSVIPASGGGSDRALECDARVSKGSMDEREAGAASTTAVNLFTGDALFVCGCGRINTGGDHCELHHSLLQVIAKAGPPADTKVWVGHEYTEANIRFALAVEPGNKALRERAEKVKAARAEGRPTVPSTLADELATNPFLRPGAPEVRAYVRAADGASDADVVGALRAAKDSFGMGAKAGRREPST